MNKYTFPVFPRQQQRRQRGPAQAAAAGRRSLPPPRPSGPEPQREDRTPAGGLRVSLR